MIVQITGSDADFGEPTGHVAMPTHLLRAEMHHQMPILFSSMFRSCNIKPSAAHSFSCGFHWSYSAL